MYVKRNELTIKKLWFIVQEGLYSPKSQGYNTKMMTFGAVKKLKFSNELNTIQQSF